MAIETLAEADFETVDVDTNGKFTFSNVLSKLRRSMRGMHNKIAPVFIMNDSSNPVNVSVNAVTTGIPVVGTAQTLINIPPTAGTGATATLATITAGKTGYLMWFITVGTVLDTVQIRNNAGTAIAMLLCPANNTAILQPSCGIAVYTTGQAIKASAAATSTMSGAYVEV